MLGMTTKLPFQRESPPEKKTGTGEHAPTGRSVAGSMVSKARRGPKPPRRVPSHPAGRQGRRGVPKSPPYNPLESPYKTQGQFNQGVRQTAKSQYQPELDENTAEKAGETGLHTAREGSNVDIFNKYHQSAVDAFNQAQGSLAEVAARSKAATGAGQQTLQAALSNTGIAGLSGVADPSAFMQEATGYGNESDTSLGREQSGILGEAAKEELVPGAFADEAKAAEGQRDTGELNKIGTARQKIIKNIPNIIAKTRSEMSKQEGERETANLQNKIAGRKLGFEEKSQKENVGVQNRQIDNSNKQHHEEAAIKLKELAVNAGFESEKIDNERKKINQQISEAKTAGQKAAAELAGKRYDNGVQSMASFFHYDPKTEFISTGDPTKDKKLEEEGKVLKQYDPMALYQMLTKGNNLNAPEAFRIMQASGHPGVVSWSREHEEDYNSRIRLRTHPPHQIAHRRNYVAPPRHGKR